MGPRGTGEAWRPQDTDLEAHERQVEAGIRSRHPDYSEEQVLWALRRLWLGDDLVRQAWPDRELVRP
jgi:hypothetical protein